jgi:hypothetical protein
MKPRIELLVAAALFLILILSGCGGANSPTTSTALQAEARAISVAMGASPDHLGAAETATFTATVSNATNTAVTWSVSGCTSACGTINDSGVYTAPPFVASATTVTITATSRADATKSASVNLALRPVSVSLAPNTPSNVIPGTTRSFAATLDHDPKNAGVTWTLAGAGCSGDACGTLMNVTSTSAIYCAPPAEPSPNAVTLVATSVTDPNQKSWVTLTVSGTPFHLEGKYAFLINGWGQGGLEAMAGQFTADGKGNLSGVWDANRGAAADVAQAITGSYNIQSNGHGTMTLQAGSSTFTYVVSIDSAGATARFAESTVPPANEHRGSSGYMVKPDANSFTLSSIQGDRVIATYGAATGSHVAALGRFTGSGAGMVSNGVMDLSWEINQNVAKFPNTAALTGTFGMPDPTTGRGTASLNVAAGATATYHFAYYIVSDDRILLVQTDARGLNGGLLIPTLSGEVRHQNNAGSFANASLNAPVVFHLTDSTDDWMGLGYAKIRVGQMVPNGAGALNTTYDQNVGGRDPEMIGYESGGKITLNATTSAPYSVSSNGRVSWTNFPAPDFPTLPLVSEGAVAYLTDQNKGYFMVGDLDGAAFGEFEPQTGEPFSIHSLAGTYRLNTGPPARPGVENDVGWMTLADDGTATATLYVNTGSGATPVPLTATVAVAGDGRGTVTFNTAPPSVARNVVFWAISPTRCVALSTVNPGDTKPVLFFVERSD